MPWSASAVAVVGTLTANTDIIHGAVQNPCVFEPQARHAFNEFMNVMQHDMDCAYAGCLTCTRIYGQEVFAGSYLCESKDSDIQQQQWGLCLR